jgi:hypothetical protein
MPYESFHSLFPEIAAKETRTITVLNHKTIPTGQYVLTELYCNEPDCDCRRVFFDVYDPERRKSMAIVAYGWESETFYARWYGENDPQTIRDLQGPALNLGSQQSKYARAFLALIKDILKDSNYVSRLKRHYRIFKDAVDQGKAQENDEHPDNNSLRAKSGNKKTRRGRRAAGSK